VKKTGAVAVIGAGLAGLSCAQALRAGGANVRIFERAEFVGGRCATRLWQGHLVDYGVQYFTAQTGEFKKELLTRLRQFRPIISPVLDADNNIVPSEFGPRFYVLQGNNYLAHVLSRGLEMRLNTDVDKVTFQNGKIECMGETFAALVSTLPGPQSARLLGLKQDPIKYEPCLTALIEYGSGDMARECYARVMPEETGSVAASYCENHKAGRIVGQKTVFVVNASPRFSRKHLDEPSENYLPTLIKENAKLWRITDQTCTASSIHRWTYAHPRPDSILPVTLPPGAFLCGDSLVPATVEAVWTDGQRAAHEVLAYLA